MASAIKPLFSAALTSWNSLTISGNSLATSTAGVGQQSTLVDNSSNRYGRVRLIVKVKQGTSPTGNKAAYVYALRGDGTTRTDNAGASDAGHTVLNAKLLGVLINKSSPSTGDILRGDFVFNNPGPEWGITIVHDTGVNLDSSAGIAVTWIGENPEIQ